MKVERYRKRGYWGGASAYQKGVAAELRSQVRNRSLLKNLLNTIVHSGDPTVMTSFAKDPTNTYSPIVDDVIVSAIKEVHNTHQPINELNQYWNNRLSTGVGKNHTTSVIDPTSTWLNFPDDISNIITSNPNFLNRQLPGANLRAEHNWVPLTTTAGSKLNDIYSQYANPGQYTAAAAILPYFYRDPRNFLHNEVFKGAKTSGIISNPPLLVKSMARYTLPTSVVENTHLKIPAWNRFAAIPEFGSVDANGQVRLNAPWRMLHLTDGYPFPNDYRYLALYNARSKELKLYYANPATNDVPQLVNR